MSNLTPSPAPGLAGQSAARTVLRLLGALVTGTALVFLVLGGIDFFGSMDSFEAPTRFWMFFVGIPLLAVGGWMLMAGFLGLGARYVSGEYAPVAKDTASYLTDGKGILNVGATRASGAASVPGPFCRSCGTRNDVEARFCDSCGTAMG
jgi:hypothetical protein